MKKLFSTVLFFLICNSMYTQNKLTINPSKVQLGQEITYTYTGKLAKTGTTVTAILYTLINDIEKTVKIEFKENKLEWKLNIPDSVVYVSFKVKNGDDIDNNNGTGYGFNVYQNEKPVPGTYLIQGFINLTCKESGIPINYKIAVELMEKEYKLNPQLKENDYTTTWYLGALSETNRKEEAIALARKMYDRALQKNTDTYNIMSYLDTLYPENTEKRDSLLTEAVKLYPKSKLSFSLKMEELYNCSDPDKVFQLYDVLLKNFPQECKQQQENIDRVLTIAYRKKKDYVNFEYYLAKRQHDKAFQAEQLNGIAWELASANQNLHVAKSYSERALALMDTLSKSDKPFYYNSQAEWNEYLEKTTGNCYDTYGSIYYKLGNKQAAAENQQYAVTLKAGEDTDINEKLVKYLLENNQPKEALAKSEEFKIAQQSNVKIDSMYIVAYVAVNGSTKGLDAAKANIYSQIKDAPDFTLKSMDGKSVTLSSMKGKIVILDLWATWSGPCLASFSGMQKAVNAFQDRDDVCFYFINTFERTSQEIRLAKIREILENKKVNFNVLLDEQAGNNYMVSKLYGINKIPIKIIIDKNGKFYTTILGNNDNEEEMINELKSIVEILK